MSDWMVHLAFAEGNSSKFWRARVEGKTLYVNYGKIGAAGQTQVKELADAAAAKAEFDKLVREKRKKGYEDAGGAGAARDEDADADGDDEADDSDSDGEEEEDTRAARKPGKRAAKPAVAPAGAAKPAASSPGTRLVLDAGSRKVETTIALEGSVVRMDSRETYGSAEAARAAFDRLLRMLGGEGYKQS